MSAPAGDAGEAPAPLVTSAAFGAAHRALWDSYVATQRALRHDDAQAARASVAPLSAAREALAAAAPLDEVARAPWSRADALLARALEALAAADDLEGQRGAFETLAGAITALAEAYGPALEHVWEVHCPMAFERGASWLQDGPGVENPYMGDAMPRCGSVTRELHGAGHDG
jgi:hypothetical protein